MERRGALVRPAVDGNGPSTLGRGWNPGEMDPGFILVTRSSKGWLHREEIARFVVHRRSDARWHRLRWQRHHAGDQASRDKEGRDQGSPDQERRDQEGRKQKELIPVCG